MAKSVFKPTEITNLTTKAVIESPQKKEEETKGLVEGIEEYTGPTAEDLRREADLFKEQWDLEKKQMIESAEAEAQRIRIEAEEYGKQLRAEKEREVDSLRNAAREQSEETLAEAEQKAKEIEEESRLNVSRIEAKALEKGKAEGREGGYKAGQNEVKHLIDSLHSIITKAIGIRSEIIRDSETQIIDLVLLIARKVVKVISENQQKVVVNNVLEALKKLKSKGEVIIRINPADLEITTKHKKGFLEMVEAVQAITLLEDSSIAKGGCVIDTDFGNIDARISSQLHEIEERIMELMPIRSEGEGEG